MKLMKRKLLSLLLAMAMILTLAPTALAETYSLTLSDLSLKMKSNPTGTIAVTGLPDEGTPTSVNWTSSNENAATVSNTGAVTAVGAGETTVTATYTYSIPPVTDEEGNETTPGRTDTYSGECTVSVAAADPAVATKLTLGTVTPSRLTVGSSATATVTATVLDQYNDPMAGVSVTATLTSSSTATGASATGGTTGSDGKATITVSPGSVAGMATFSVSAAGLVDAFSVPVDANKPTVTLAAPTPANIYSGAEGSANRTATMEMTTTGDLTDYTLSWNVTPDNALALISTTIAKSYTLTAGNVISPTTVKIQAVLTNKNNSTDKAISNEVTLTVNPSEVFTLTPSPANNAVINWNSLKLYGGGYYDFSVTPKWVSHGNDVTKNSTIEYKWVLNNGTRTEKGPTVSLASSDLAYSQNNTLTCTATFKYPDGSTADTKSATWTINKGYSGNVLATATVATSTSSFALGDTDDAGKSSISDQLENYFNNATRGYYGLVSVRFSNVKDGSNGSLNATTGTDYYANRQGGTNAKYLSDVLFYPASTKTTATFQATFYYYNTRNWSYNSPSDISSMTGSITFSVVESASNGDITYNASIGDDVTFAVKDFEDFYYSKTRGNLSYVTFTLPSGGTLYADGGRLNTSNACYAAPGRTQTDLAGVYFSPSGTTATRAGTVRISFNAYGTRSTASGTVAITYLSGTAKDITYNIATSGNLKASDFTDAYRQVVGSAAPTGLTIEFQNVPTYGTLSYKDSSRSSSSTVTLRANNVKTYKFTTRTSGSNQLNDVTYTANGSHTDTIDYIAYVNNTPQFTGKVVFNSSNTSAANMQVGFTSSNGQAVTFSYAEFAKANATVMASTSYIRFVTMPIGGTLTYNGTVMTLSSTNVPPASLGNVVYRPNAGFNNSTDRVSFLCYDANGNSVGGGQVSIVVTGNGNNGATVVDSFKDVSATAWYRSDLITLVSAGIIQGRGDGKFDPTAELTYGEALKIFMLASGYPKQAEASGKDWAINYKNLAVNNGWISSTVDLSAKISRNAMAELAAKSLGVSPTDGVPPTWKDGTSNGYSNALYYTNPQILIGNADGTFKGNDTLKRQEICAIAARVLTYRSNQQSSVKPDGI